MASTIGGYTFLPELDTLAEVLRTRDDLGLTAEWIQSHKDEKLPFQRLEFKV